MRKYIPTIALMLLLPALAMAQGQDVWSLWAYLFRLIAKITQLFWVLTTLVFLWGLVNFMRNAESDKERGNAKKMMLGSIVAFFLAVSFWGLSPSQFAHSISLLIKVNHRRQPQINQKTSTLREVFS